MTRQIVTRIRKHLRDAFRRWLRRGPQPDYAPILLEELPDELEEGVLYVCGEGGHLWSVSFVCPCGCGEGVHLSLHRDGLPRWRLDEHEDGTVSIWPSIWRIRGCRSHFWIRHGTVRWASSVAEQQGER